MKPGDMVKNMCFLDFYPTAQSVNERLPDAEVPKNSIGVVISPPNGTWVKWMVDGRIGWSNFTLMQVIE